MLSSWSCVTFPSAQLTKSAVLLLLSTVSDIEPLQKARSTTRDTSVSRKMANVGTGIEDCDVKCAMSVMFVMSSSAKIARKSRHARTQKKPQLVPATIIYNKWQDRSV
mmetsp:Transcript_43624/g.89189  ORF Transcript_43624/g.89189 Transcript_43624/m.89189 type:complete len:108 (+) Transcript_43624:3-326(+)